MFASKRAVLALRQRHDDPERRLVHEVQPQYAVRASYTTHKSVLPGPLHVQHKLLVQVLVRTSSYKPCTIVRTAVRATALDLKQKLYYGR